MIRHVGESREPGFDFVVRCFAPGGGINEDPVTGSANCILSTFWRDRLGKDQFVSKQISRRGGVIRTRTTNNRVEIMGQAVTVFRAQWKN